MSTSFPSSFSNIPLINLREEFKATRALLDSPEVESWFTPPWQHGPIQAPQLVWYGNPEDLVGLLLQRSIVGLEAYLPGALEHEAARRNVSSQELTSKLNKPSSMGSKSSVANLFHRLPLLVDTALSLRHHDQALYERTVTFYKKVRNPLFHGKELRDPKVEEIRFAFDHIGALYRWIDGWHDPKSVFPKSIQMGPLEIVLPITFTEDAP